MERRGVLIDVEEEEEERRDTEDEEEQGKAKDYESIIVYDSFDDRYYLDDDHSTNKFKSNQNDVGLWPIIDFKGSDKGLIMGWRMSSEKVQMKLM
ncbi:myb-like protein X [Vespula maculifrons]|uniref:Myb-like protein X n=1 Tax=Vespula maculifrons TaxID=7453 RepID=A0ABD2AH79_VESMC